MRVSVKKKAITTTALISMTDVVFLLLIFLLITSNFVSYTGIDINVPVSENAHNEIKKNITLSINEAEQIFVNGTLVDKTLLVGALKAELEKTPEALVMIQADQNIALKYIVELIDLAKSAGTSKFFIAARMAGSR